MVPMAGVEPAQLSPLPPQGSVSTNFTTSALFVYSGTTGADGVLLFSSTLVSIGALVTL